jgi:3-isopropylmalate/(R)-2-methylmalate dehydratase small subunit
MTADSSVDTAPDLANLTGKAWVFPQDYINTDAIMPRAGYDLPPKEQDALVLNSVRPGWAANEVGPGDLLIAGRNFGTGSSRPAVTLLTRLGVAGIIAESVAEIFFRNCISYAMPVLECPGVLAATTEGDTVKLDIVSGTFTNVTTGKSLTGAKMPRMLLDTIAAGGAYALLRNEGYM